MRFSPFFSQPSQVTDEGFMHALLYIVSQFFRVLFRFHTYHSAAENLKASHKSEAGKINTKKGFVYTLEVMLAIAIIFLTIVFVFRFVPPTPQSDLGIIKKQGFEAMEYMDQYYDLRLWVSEGNETSIESQLKQLLPSNIRVEAEICRQNCSAANVPVKFSVVSVDYYISRYRDSFVGWKVKVWLWRGSPV